MKSQPKEQSQPKEKSQSKESQSKEGQMKQIPNRPPKKKKKSHSKPIHVPKTFQQDLSQLMNKFND